MGSDNTIPTRPTLAEDIRNFLCYQYVTIMMPWAPRWLWFRLTPWWWCWGGRAQFLADIAEMEAELANKNSPMPEPEISDEEIARVSLLVHDTSYCGSPISEEDFDAILARLRRVEAELAEAREALKPFADAQAAMIDAGYDDPPSPRDDETLTDDGAFGTLSRYGILTFGHFRRARAFLDKTQNARQPV